MPAFHGKYRVIRELGRGGMGTVFEVEHRELRTRHALKVIRSRKASDLRRFEQEARTAAPLQSPHVVRVSEVGTTDDGVSFIVMDALAGESLQEAIDRGISVADILRVVCDVCGALAEAHDKGIVHRDLKPDNIFLANEGEVVVAKILDFGIAKILATSPAEGTVNSRVLGTPDYMPPEQFDGVGVDHRVDVFAMGCILYRALSGGRPPFPREGDMPPWAAVRAAPAVPLEYVAPEVPLPVAGAVMRALERDRADRFSSIRELAAELSPFARSTALPARIDPKKRRRAKSRPSVWRRVRTSWLVACVVILAMAGIAAIWVHFGK